MIFSKDVLYVSILSENFRRVIDYNYVVSKDFESDVEEAMNIIMIKDGKVVLPKPTDNYVIIGILDSTFHNFSYIIVINRNVKYQTAIHIIEHIKFELEQQFTNNPIKKEEFINTVQINNKYYDPIRTFYREFICNIVRNHLEFTIPAQSFIESSSTNNLDNVISQNLEKFLRRKINLNKVIIEAKTERMKNPDNYFSVTVGERNSINERKNTSGSSWDAFIKKSSSNIDNIVKRRNLRKCLCWTFQFIIVITVMYVIMGIFCGFSLEYCFHKIPTAMPSRVVIRLRQRPMFDINSDYHEINETYYS